MKPLRIAIDARELLGARTGAGRFLGELLARWVVRPDAASRELLLYSPEPLTVHFSGTRACVLGGRPGTKWEQTSLASAVRRDGPDLFFAPAYTAPLFLRPPLVVAIHDVSFSRHPEWFRPRERHRRHLLTRSAARRAGAVITGSEFSRQEIQDLYGVAAAKLHVIPYGFTPRRVAAGATREPLVLFAGSIFNRRRVPDLIAAFAAAQQLVPEARLVLTGSDRTWPRQDLRAIARAHGVEDRVTLRDYVTEEELDDLYARASAFGFLSEYEGFGFTPLEALAAGVPAVVLDTPVAREIYGDAVTFVPPGDVRAAADALVRLLSDRAAAEAHVSRAGDVLSRYSWDTAAAHTLALLERIARR